jgi:L-cysteate sulfo-lyase
MTDVLAGIPRIDLGFTPTPLEPLDRLSEALGGPRLWIKRDDCTGLATGGNKTRKLEFLMADAKAQRADTVITFGAVQSNHARQTAAACAKLGLECHLILTRRVTWRHPEYETNGNVLLDRLLGAHLHVIETADTEGVSGNLIDKLSQQGKRCYTVPTGGSNSTGALGYVRCATEIVDQTRRIGFQPDLIVHATSSGGTQAGLIAGLVANNSNCGVLGINVYDTDHDRIERRITRLLDETLNRVKLPANAPARVRIVHDFLGEDYGIPTRQTLDAMATLGASEGIVTDPVYSGKALGGLFEMIRRKDLSACNNVVFVHTGGAASLPVYSSAFASDGRYE